MRHVVFFAPTLAVVLAALPWLTGCESTGGGGKHEVVAQSADQVIGCQACYDEAVRVRRTSGKGLQWKKNQIIKKHMCPDCKGEMTSYTQDGTPMVKCAKCAPEGVACSRCLPPKEGA